jgi:hypothetical protein
VGIYPDTLSAIAGLPGDWHASGNLGGGVIRRLAALLAEHFPGGVALSAETGRGKSTLLFSHAGREHLCFTLEGGDAYAKTAASPLLDRGRVRFVLGPSQRTLQRHEWSAPLDVALIDGGHGYPSPDLDYYGFCPRVRPGGLLVVDDIHTPTITSLFRFLQEDAMWRLVAVELYRPSSSARTRPPSTPSATAGCTSAATATASRTRSGSRPPSGRIGG